MVKTDLSKYNNDWYNPGNPLKRILWYFTNILFFQNPFFPISSVKLVILKLFGAKIGSGVVIKPKVNIKYPWFLEIGENTWVGEDVWIDNLAKVKIGKNCCLSQGALLLTGNHNYKKIEFDLITQEIIIEDGAWVGAKAIVTPGTKMGSHSILSVGSVSTGALEPYHVYQGNPAIKIRERIIEHEG
ncbi:MAG: WcaF family extracellular polysaccharide biosynthesis acetyltransferase [Salibacteraceae bacterium]